MPEETSNHQTEVCYNEDCQSLRLQLEHWEKLAAWSSQVGTDGLLNTPRYRPSTFTEEIFLNPSPRLVEVAERRVREAEAEKAAKREEELEAQVYLKRKHLEELELDYTNLAKKFRQRRGAEKTFKLQLEEKEKEHSRQLEEKEKEVTRLQEMVQQQQQRHARAKETFNRQLLQKEKAVTVLQEMVVRKQEQQQRHARAEETFNRQLNEKEKALSKMVGMVSFYQTRQRELEDQTKQLRATISKLEWWADSSSSSSSSSSSEDSEEEEKKKIAGPREKKMKITGPREKKMKITDPDEDLKNTFQQFRSTLDFLLENVSFNVDYQQ